MSTNGESDVGRFKLELKLANNDDVSAAERGDLDATKVRRLTIPGVVDSGAAHLVLPEAAAKTLGLPGKGKAMVRYADGRTVERPRVKGVYLELLGRDVLR